MAVITQVRILVPAGFFFFYFFYLFHFFSFFLLFQKIFDGSCEEIERRKSCRHLICNEREKRKSFVCGDNGQTYTSACEMRRISCILRKPIERAYSGECQKSSKTKVSVLDVREPDLTRIENPAELDQKYDITMNENQFNARKNLQLIKKRLKMCKFGAKYSLSKSECFCDIKCSNDSKNDLSSKNGTILGSRSKRAEHSEFCGTDGNTYFSICQLRRASCSSQKWITRASDAICGIVRPSTTLATLISTTTIGIITEPLKTEKTDQCDVCNKLGSRDCLDGVCVCKNGVGGDKCDRCQPGYFNIKNQRGLGCMEEKLNV